MRKTSLSLFLLGTLFATPSIAGAWSETEVNAAIASIDKSYLR